VLLQQLGQLGEVSQRSGEAIDLVDHDHIDGSFGDIFKEPLKGRADHRPSREAAIVIEGGQGDPAFMLLADDEGLAGIPLGIEGVEALLQTLVAALAGIDGAAETAGYRMSRRRRGGEGASLPSLCHRRPSACR
jgi:hypothetical protein